MKKIKDCVALLLALLVLGTLIIAPVVGIISLVSSEQKKQAVIKPQKYSNIANPALYVHIRKLSDDQVVGDYSLNIHKKLLEEGFDKVNLTLFSGFTDRPTSIMLVPLTKGTVSSTSNSVNFYSLNYRYTPTLSDVEKFPFENHYLFLSPLVLYKGDTMKKIEKFSVTVDTNYTYEANAVISPSDELLKALNCSTYQSNKDSSLLIQVSRPLWYVCLIAILLAFITIPLFSLSEACKEVKQTDTLAVLLPIITVRMALVDTPQMVYYFDFYLAGILILFGVVKTTKISKLLLDSVKNSNKCFSLS